MVVTYKRSAINLWKRLWPSLLHWCFRYSHFKIFICCDSSCQSNIPQYWLFWAYWAMFYKPCQGSSIISPRAGVLTAQIWFGQSHGGVSLEPRNPYPFLRVILADKGTHFSQNIGPFVTSSDARFRWWTRGGGTNTWKFWYLPNFTNQFQMIQNKVDHTGEVSGEWAIQLGISKQFLKYIRSFLKAFSGEK